MNEICDDGKNYLNLRRGPHTIAWHVFAVIATVNRTVQLD